MGDRHLDAFAGKRCVYLYQFARQKGWEKRERGSRTTSLIHLFECRILAIVRVVWAVQTDRHGRLMSKSLKEVFHRIHDKYRNIDSTIMDFISCGTDKQAAQGEKGSKELGI